MVTQVKLSLRVDSNGNVTFVYHDKLKQVLKCLGAMNVFRASHVEPDENGEWFVDIPPLDGKYQGEFLGPFKFREQALKAEVKWLKKNLNL